jgi:hypothetical protein
VSVWTIKTGVRVDQARLSACPGPVCPVRLSQPHPCSRRRDCRFRFWTPPDRQWSKGQMAGRQAGVSPPRPPSGTVTAFPQRTGRHVLYPAASTEDSLRGCRPPAPLRTFPPAHGTGGVDTGLTAKQVKAVRPAVGPERLSDGHGLYLRVCKSGRKPLQMRLGADDTTNPERSMRRCSASLRIWRLARARHFGG